MKRMRLPMLFGILFTRMLIGQPYLDMVNLSSQILSTTFRDSLSSSSRTFKGALFSIDNNIAVIVPVPVNPRCTLIVRTQIEDLHFRITGPAVNMTSRYYMLTFSAGMQWTNKQGNCKLLIMGTPRYCIQKSEMSTSGTQYGGMLLGTWIPGAKLRIKAGLYYNREFFGHFFVPLLGLDWVVTESKRWNMFGVLPNNMKIEWSANKTTHLGLAYRNYQRSYVSYTFYADSFSFYHKNGYFRMRESELKLYADVYVRPKVVLFAEAGYTINYATELSDPVNGYSFGLMEQFMGDQIAPRTIFTVGFAYRIPTEKSSDDIIHDNAHPQ